MARFRQLGGGDLPVTTFSDALTGAGPSLGRNWAQGIFSHTPFVAPFSWGTATIFAAPDLVNALGWSTGGSAGPNTILSAVAVPVPTYQSLYGRSQFSQATFVNSTGVVNNATWEVGVMIRLDEEDRYVCTCSVNAANSCRLYRVNQSTFTLLAGGVANPAPTAVIRISAIVSSTNVTLSVTSNGVVILAAVDAAAGRLTAGSPGLGSEMSSGTYFFRTYSCGLL